MTKINYDPTCNYSGVDIQFHIHKYGKRNDSYLDGHDKRYEHYKDHYNGLLNDMKDQSKANTYTDCSYAWSQGKSASSGELKDMIEMSEKFSPEEINDAADNGLISKDEANALIMVGALKAGGMSDDDIQDAMKNYYALDSQDQASVLKLMSNRDVAHEVDEERHYGTDKYSYKDTPDKLTGQQMRAAVFLSEAKTSQLGNLRQFIDLAYSTDDYPAVSEFKDLKSWGELGDTQRRDLGKLVQSLPDKTQEEAALEGYGHSYHLYTAQATKDKVIAGVQAMKDSVDVTVSDIESKLDSGEDLTFTSQDDMKAYLAKNVTGYDAMPVDVKDALADYALQQIASHVTAGMGGADGTMSRDDVAAYCASHIDGWANLSEDDQNKIIDGYMNASDPDVGVDDNGNYVKTTYNADGSKNTSVVGKVLTPADLRGAGLDKDGTMDVGTLMFLVLMDRENSQQELIRGYADDVDAKNQDVKNATKSLSKLRAQDSGDTVDIEDLTFTSQSGEETSIYDFCQAYGVDIPEDGDGDPKTDLDKTGVQSLIDSIKSSSDTMTTDAQSALQKLQQAIDRMTNTNSLISNFESTWTSMQKGNINNMNIR